MALWQELGQRCRGRSRRAHALARRRPPGRPAQRDELREAERWYQRARDLGLVAHDDRIAVALEHGATLIALRRLRRGRAHVLGAVVDASPRRRHAALGEAHTGLGVVARLLGDTDRGPGLLRRGPAGVAGGR